MNNESKIIKLVETAFSRELKATIMSKNSWTYLATKKCLELSYNKEYQTILTFLRPSNRKFNSVLLPEEVIKLIDTSVAIAIDKVIASNIEKNISRTSVSPNDYILAMALYEQMSHIDGRTEVYHCDDGLARFSNPYSPNDLVIDANDIETLMSKLYTFIKTVYDGSKETILHNMKFLNAGILKNGNGVPDAKSAKGYMLNTLSMKLQSNEYIADHIGDDYSETDKIVMAHEFSNVLHDIVILMYPELTDIHVEETAELFASPLKDCNCGKYIDTDIMLYYFGAFVNVSVGDCFDSNDFFMKFSYEYKFKSDEYDPIALEFSTTFNEIKNVYEGNYIPKFTESLYTFISSITNIIYS